MKAVAAIVSMLLGACFSPSFGDGQFVCGPERACPPGFTCDGAGACVRDPAGADPVDAATPGADAPATPTADAAANADARAPQPARVYVFDTDTSTWSHEAAAAYFNGAGGPDPALVQTAWSHCTGSFAQILCVGTNEGWHCTDDGAASWYGAKWGDVLKDFEAAAPTFTTALDTKGILDDAWFTSGELWWEGRYFQPPMRLFGTSGDWSVMLETSYESPGRDRRNAEWGATPNAPPSGSAITADYTRAGTWYLWTADGTEYAMSDDAWAVPGPAPVLSEAGAPPAELVTAAAMCAGDLYVVTRAD